MRVRYKIWRAKEYGLKGKAINEGTYTDLLKLREHLSFRVASALETTKGPVVVHVEIEDDDIPF